MESDEMIYAVTLSGGRPECFDLCKKFIHRQTYPNFKWVVVDDCEPETDTTGANIVLRPWPQWGKAVPRNTLCRNLSMAMETIMSLTPGAVVIVEDDDWYHQDYIWHMVDLLDQNPDADIVGEGWTKYYNVRFRASRRNLNAHHASLCATAWRTSFIPSVLDCIEHHQGIPFIDMRLFRDNQDRAVVVDTDYCIGIKGMPGRPGTGKGHRYMNQNNATMDPEMKRFKNWIGNDIELYAGYYKPEPEKPPNPRSRRQRRRVLAGKQYQIDEAARLARKRRR